MLYINENTNRAELTQQVCDHEGNPGLHEFIQLHGGMLSQITTPKLLELITEWIVEGNEV